MIALSKIKIKYIIAQNTSHRKILNFFKYAPLVPVYSKIKFHNIYIINKKFKNYKILYILLKAKKSERVHFNEKIIPNGF